MNKTTGVVPGVIGNILVVVFAVLCMLFLAVLSLTTWRNADRLSDASAASVTAYYRADAQAEAILAQLRQGIVPDGVEADGNIYRYSCQIDDGQILDVRVEVYEDGYQVLQWQAVYSGEYLIDDSLPVWTGQ